MHQIIRRISSKKSISSLDSKSFLLDLGENKNDYVAIKSSLSKQPYNSYQFRDASSAASEILNKTRFITIDCSKDEEGLLNSTLNRLNLDTQKKPLTLKEIPWFPKTFNELSKIHYEVLTFGTGLDSDHPSFQDAEYRVRRSEIAEIAINSSVVEENVPRINYSKAEHETWRVVNEALTPLHKKYACAEYNDSVKEMRKYKEFSENFIPQLDDVTKYLKEKTNFKFFPVAGYITPRDFLSLLAFRVFPCTQYIRHESEPFYTPEPDVVHELIGHAPLFANKDFADFSQEIGLASLGATEKDIKRLAACYLYTVEFGLIINKNSEKKMYGAGMLSSASEIMNFVDEKSECRYFNPEIASEIDFPITTLQPIYWWSHSFSEAKDLVTKFVKTLQKDFVTNYDSKSKSIKIEIIQ